MEHQRQQLIKERQQFQLEQLKTVELRQRQLSAQNLLAEGKLVIPTVIVNQVVAAPQPPTVVQLQAPPQAKTPQPMASAAPTPPPQQSQPQQQPQQSVTPQPSLNVPSPAPATTTTTTQLQQQQPIAQSIDNNQQQQTNPAAPQSSEGK